MEQRYAEWIERYVAAQPQRFVRGKCEEATRLMVEEFPELRRVCGLALCTWGNDQHWWCAAPDGTVIDPTVSQFAAVFGYEELDPVKDRDKIPTGKCLDCGEAVFMGRTFCDETCERRTRAYLGC